MIIIDQESNFIRYIVIEIGASVDRWRRWYGCIPISIDQELQPYDTNLVRHYWRQFVCGIFMDEYPLQYKGNTYGWLYLRFGADECCNYHRNHLSLGNSNCYFFIVNRDGWYVFVTVYLKYEKKILRHQTIPKLPLIFYREIHANWVAWRD